jgi:peptidoglycan hydrolase CwlO-like protein
MESFSPPSPSKFSPIAAKRKKVGKGKRFFLFKKKKRKKKAYFSRRTAPHSIHLGAVDDTIIGGVDPDSFMFTRSFSVLNNDNTNFEKEAAHISMELKLKEAQNRVRSLSTENRKRMDSDSKLAQERLKNAKRERHKAEEISELTSLNRSLAEDLEREKAAVKPTGNVKELQVQLRAKDREIERLQRQLANVSAVAEHGQLAIAQLSSLSQKTTQTHRQSELQQSQYSEVACLKVELERQATELKAAKRKLHVYEDMEVENSRLRKRVSDLELASAKRGLMEEAEKGSLRLREENNMLKQKVSRLQSVGSKLVKTETELERVNGMLAKWKVVVGEKYPSLEHVQNEIATLNGKVNTLQSESEQLAEKCAGLEKDAKTHQSQLSVTKKRVEAKEVALEEQRQMVGRMEAQVKLLKETCVSNQVILDSFNKEGSSFSNYDASKSERIEQLEGLLKKQTEFSDKLQSDCKRLGEDLEKTRERMFTLESRLTEGEFNPDTVQVVHFRMNPLVSEADEKSKNIAKLSAENEMLKKRLRASKKSGASSVEIDALKKDNINLAKRLERLKQIAQSKITEFREIVVLLFGYRVDVEFDSHVYTLTPLNHAQDKLKFKSSDSGLQLLETEYALTLNENVTQYLQHFDSIPAFLSAITIIDVRQQSKK